MLEGTRLQYIVPGYKGQLLVILSSHIPQQHQDDGIPFSQQEARYEIPGYDGYICSVKSENLVGNTYGTTTYNVRNGEFVKGQDIPCQNRYTSQYQDSYQDQSQVLRRTAAQIVGVQPKQYQYSMPLNENTIKQTVFEIEDKPTQEQLAQIQANKFNEDCAIFYGEQEKDYIKLGEPLPGYTGSNRRVVAANIFGKTYANSRKAAKVDMTNMNIEKTQTFNSTSKQIPPIKY